MTISSFRAAGYGAIEWVPTLSEMKDDEFAELMNALQRQSEEASEVEAAAVAVLPWVDAQSVEGRWRAIVPRVSGQKTEFELTIERIGDVTCADVSGRVG